MQRSVVLVVGLVGCSGKGPPVETPVPPEPVPVTAPVPVTPDPVAGGLPTWDEVTSGHPAGATNPPRPVLVVKPDGRCFKQWVSPMLPPAQVAERTSGCTDDCGTAIVCPDSVGKDGTGTP